jgi:hypothetical protein
MEMCRDFASFQFMTIQKENHHSFLIAEHDPMHYEDAGEMVEYMAQAQKQTSRGGYHPALRARAGPSPAEDARAGRSGVLLLRRAGSGQSPEGRGEDAGSAENAGGVLMRWPWRREARPIEPRRAADPKVIELQTAKEILAEVFGARPGEGEEMIQRRLEESGPTGYALAGEVDMSWGIESAIRVLH